MNDSVGDHNTYQNGFAGRKFPNDGKQAVIVEYWFDNIQRYEGLTISIPANREYISYANAASTFNYMAFRHAAYSASNVLLKDNSVISSSRKFVPSGSGFIWWFQTTVAVRRYYADGKWVNY
jgi:hypothetical protein